MARTYFFGNDCLGNTSHAVTIEGVCIGDIYEPQATRHYNQSTKEHGVVFRGDDGELHFKSADQHKQG
jgi:hypothetical protein